MPKNKNTRPLKDMVRESIFNLLVHSNKISIKFGSLKIVEKGKISNSYNETYYSFTF